MAHSRDIEEYKQHLKLTRTQREVLVGLLWAMGIWRLRMEEEPIA